MKGAKMKLKNEITIGMYYNILIWFNIDHPFVSRIPIINRLIFKIYLERHIKNIN